MTTCAPAGDRRSAASMQRGIPSLTHVGHAADSAAIVVKPPPCPACCLITTLRKSTLYHKHLVLSQRNNFLVFFSDLPEFCSKSAAKWSTKNFCADSVSSSVVKRNKLSCEVISQRGHRAAVTLLRQTAMLSEKEKEMIKEIWDRLIPVAEDIGSDALLRMFTTFPGSKTYFSHLDISPRSPHMLSHGKKIVLAIAEGAKDISQLMVTLAPLQTLHAYQLRIDPWNFKLLSHCMLVSLACHLGDDFTHVAHAAMDKYLSAFAAVLAEKYR